MKKKLSNNKINLLIIALALLTNCKDSVNEPVKETPTGLPGYQIVWQDEFNSPTLDLTKWNIETGTGINGDWGTGQLDRATGNPKNISIQSGITGADGSCLAITTQKEFYIDRNYTSGRINTMGKVSYGPGYRVEARVWAKDVRYKGQGFAFWMMPDEKPTGYTSIMWPQGGEIDIMEYIGSIPFCNLGSVHYAWSWENNQYQDWNHAHHGSYYQYQQQQQSLTNPSYGGYPPSLTDEATGSYTFHNYGIEWYNDRIEFFCDNNVYHIHYFADGAAFDNNVPDGNDEALTKTVNGKRVLYSEYSNHFNEWYPFIHKFYIILSAGVGGSDQVTYGGAIVPEAVFPCSVYIDWVRVYKRL